LLFKDLYLQRRLKVYKGKEQAEWPGFRRHYEILFLSNQ
jgi:hypothetical protein